jgi:hypothetical protein
MGRFDEDAVVNDKFFGSHEIQDRQEIIKTSSDRGFGYVVAVFCALIAGLSLYNGGMRWPWWLAGAAVFLFVARIRPTLLAPLNRAWTKLGLLLAAVVSPIALAIIFYLSITPIGWLMRLMGMDPLHLRPDPHAKSYWVLREPPGPAADTFKNQF